jgi:GT2 family glycosyltransferase
MNSKQGGMRPRISVVIACVNGLPWIDDCLKALKKQQGGIRAETIVVCCCKDETPDHIRTHFPAVKLIQPGERKGIPELRTIGVAEASGEIIVITEDHCLGAPNWFQEISRAHESGYDAIGGAVENGSVDRLTDWAVYLCEYSGVMPPIPDAEVEGIAGNNAAYKRELLDRVDSDILKNYWEYFIQAEMRKLGARFLSVPSILVYHKKEFGFFYFLAQRFHYSRSFAGMRRSRVTFFKKILYALSSPFLPFLLTIRIARDVLRKRRYLKELLLTSPLLLTFMVSYTVGELVGYVFGGGDSLLKVE